MSIPPEDDEVSRDLTPRATRTNLLLSGTIEAPDIVAPVRIRNLSETGALLEGSALPKVGAHLVLKRSSLEMGAIVIWSSGSRCGIAFEGSISVAGWRTGTWVETIGIVDQSRVDAIQAAVRAGAAPVETEVPKLEGKSRLSTAEMDARIAKELKDLRHTLEQMGDQLSDEPVIVQKYPTAIQGFDLACQTLGHLADVLNAQDRTIAVEGIGMQELRIRLGK